MPHSTLAKRLRQARQRAGLTGKAVQAKTGINYATLSLIENDHQEPSLDQLRKLARAFRVRVVDLLSSGRSAA